MKEIKKETIRTFYYLSEYDQMLIKSVLSKKGISIKDFFSKIYPGMGQFCYMIFRGERPIKPKAIKKIQDELGIALTVEKD